MIRRSLLLLPLALWHHPVLAAGPSNLDVQAHFECLWWAEHQMERLRADSPLPKTTRVRLPRWEYSDPIGVPNPDEVILVVTLRASTARTVTLSVRTRWKIRAWANPEPLPDRSVVLEAGVPHNEEFIIPVRAMIYDRSAKRLAAHIWVDRREVTRVELPVLGGD